jgi:SAM-dependent methyltransferase
MAFVDKKGIIQSLGTGNSAILDIGCGPLKRKPDWIGIDLLDSEGVDLVGDIYEIVKAIPANSIDEIHSFHFFEHIPDVPSLLIELQRILKPDGFIEIVVPHFSNPYFYSDYTHATFFGLYSLSYMASDNILRRKVPNYNLNTGLRLKSVYLRFNSPLLINRPMRKLAQLIFNTSNLMKEWYEDSWSNTFPCYEIQFILTKA